MKKLLIRLLMGLVALMLLAVLAVGFFLDSAAKRGIETVGSSLTKVEVKLDSIKLGLLSGSGNLKGLVVGNPTGYSSSSAISVGSVVLGLNPGSLFSDKVVIKTIEVVQPEVTFETDLRNSNLGTIKSNLGGGASAAQTPAAGSSARPAQAKAGKKLEVDNFLITGGKVHVTVTGVGSVTQPLPEIHLQDLGKGPEGITGAELASLVLERLEAEAAKVSAASLDDLKKQAAGIANNFTKDLAKNPTNAVQQATKGLQDLLKTK